MLCLERCIMKDLSIVIRANEEMIESYVKTLEPIFSSYQCELIIINNIVDKMDIKYNHTLYNFSGSYSKFKEFCFSSTIGRKVMIIDGNIQLDSSFIKDAMMHIKESDFHNISYSIRRFLSPINPLYYLDTQTLIYNRGIKGFNIDSEIVLNDYTLLDEAFMKIVLNRLIEDKSFNELYLWYKNFILKHTPGLEQEFYELLELEKIKLENERLETIEDLFLMGNENPNYCEYLSIKKDLLNNKELNQELISKKINALTSFGSVKYYSWIIYHIIKDRKDLSKEIFNIDVNLLKSIIDYLSDKGDFSKYFYAYLFEINYRNITDRKIKYSTTNLLLIKSYITYHSKLSMEPEFKVKLLKLFEVYVEVFEKLLEEGVNLPYNLDEFLEKEFITKFNEALENIEKTNINKVLEILKPLSIEYPSYDMVLRYYIQKIIYENSCYPFIISICMIVKDEEKNLDRCLSSLKPLLSLPSEIIIVDTGSTDKTLEIAKMYTQNIYFHKWQGNFSDARNYSLSLCEGEYIFILDADEEIEEEEIEKILTVFKSESYKDINTYTLKVKNYTDTGLKEYSIITQPRIFKNNPEFYYSGKVHNQPLFKLPIKHLQAYLTHYGYIMTEDIKDKKFQRTANMLKSELQKNPQNIYYRFQLSTSYAMHGDITKALSQAQIYMRNIREENIFSDNYLMHFNNSVILYISSYLLEEASAICDEALKIKPEFIDFIYYKALICYELREYDSAIDYTSRYLSLIDNFMSTDIANDGRYSFYSLGYKNQVIKMQMLCNYNLGNYDEVAHSITNFDNPVYKACLHAIVDSYLKTNRYSDAIKFYNNYCSNQDRKLIFRYFLEDYIQNSNKREQQLCISILTTLNCYDGYAEELEDKINYKDIPDINEGLYVIKNYDIDSLNLDEARRLFNRLLPSYNSFTTQNSPDIMEVLTYKMLGLYILHRSVELKRYKDYSPEKQINILRKYMDLSSYLIINKSSFLLDAKEQLFLIKITEGFKKLGIGDYTLTVLLLNEAIEIYKPMEGIIKLIQKNVVPNYKETSISSKPISVIIDNSEGIESYASVVKEKILEEADKKSTIDILQIFKQFSNIDLYDSELFSYKAVLLMSEGLFEDARLELDEGLRRFPNSTQLLNNLCRLYSLTQDFNKALEVFCRVKILSKGKSELELSQLIPNKYYALDFSKLKVLQGTMFPDNRINNLAAMLSRKGVYTKTLSYYPKFTGYTSDYVIDMNQYSFGADIISRTLDAAEWLIPKFDIFHFHYGSSLSFDYSDLPLLKELGKKIFVQFWSDEQDQEKLTRVSKYVSSCIVSEEETYEHVKEYFSKIYIIKPNEIDKLIDVYTS